MLETLDIVGESYSSIMAIVNFILFATLCICIAFIFVIWAIGQYDGGYKHLAHAAFLVVIGLFIIHYISCTYFGIPLLVPPIETEYFTLFIHVIQYVVTIAFVFLCVAIFIFALISRVDRSYSHAFMSACVAFAILIGIHFYIADQFGVSLIFPPTMW
jgi:hypothetical protein